MKESQKLWRYSGVGLLIILLLGTVTNAQTFPLVRTLTWDNEPASAGVINYTVTQNGVVIGNPVTNTQQITIPAAGTYTWTVTATNAFGTILPGTLTLNVTIPPPPTNFHLVIPGA